MSGTKKPVNNPAGAESRAGEAGANLTDVFAAKTYPATRTVHCPSGPTYACDDHAAQITGLMRFLGAHVVHTAAPEGAQCANCVNEAAALVTTRE